MREAKAFLSDLGPLLQSTCQHTGYSQSTSRPSKLFLTRNSTAVEMKFFLCLGLLTILLYLSPSESFQPPRASSTFLLSDFRAVTFS